MAVTKIYIVRHGFRLNWITTNWTSETGLPRDPPLAAFGVTQAEEVAEYFSSLPESERPTAIFSSPYYRCLQTSQPTSKALNVPIYVEHGLSEWYSPVAPNTGLHPRPGSASSLKKYFDEVDPEGWSSVYYPSRKGENVEQLLDRSAGLLHDLIPEVERKFEGKHQRIVLFSHAATIIALDKELLGNRDHPVRVGCCTLSEFDKDGDAWKMIKLADGSHLKEGTQREWGFEDIVLSDGHVVEDPGEAKPDEEVDEPVGSQINRRDVNL